MSKLGLPARKLERTYTYADYLAWPDDERWELIEGVAYNMCAAPNYDHQGLLGELYGQFRARLMGKPCKAYVAPADVLLPKPGQSDEAATNVVQPDLFVVCDPLKIMRNYCRGAPDLVVEILSPSTSKKDLNEKWNLYERVGVREYWVVHPDGRYVERYSLGKDGRFGDQDLFMGASRIESSAIEGLAADLGEAWAALLPADSD